MASQAMTDLLAEVVSTKAGVDSAVVFIDGLRQQIIDAGTDAVALKAITDDLAGNVRGKLANAIVTPPPPVDPPIDPPVDPMAGNRRR